MTLHLSAGYPAAAAAQLRRSLEARLAEAMASFEQASRDLDTAKAALEAHDAVASLYGSGPIAGKPARRNVHAIILDHIGEAGAEPEAIIKALAERGVTRGKTLDALQRMVQRGKIKLMGDIYMRSTT